MKKKYNVLDLFCGCGGLSKGFEMAGFNIMGGVDFNKELYRVHRKWYDMARAHNMSVNVWTVNKESSMKEMFLMGVDQLTTDNPLEARAVLKNIGYEELK